MLKRGDPIVTYSIDTRQIHPNFETRVRFGIHLNQCYNLDYNEKLLNVTGAISKKHFGTIISNLTSFEHKQSLGLTKAG